MNVTERRIADAALKLFAERGSLDVSMSDLAAAAQVARGTLYRNVDSIETLFKNIVHSLSAEMHTRVAAAMDAHGDVDPAARLATGLRMFIRVAHDNPATGLFLVRFGMTNESLREVLSGPPMRDVAAGIATHRYQLSESTQLNVASLVVSASVGAIHLVLQGYQGWRECGTNTAELILRALGIPPEEAHTIATAPLPELPDN